MDTILKAAIWSQFGAAIQTLDDLLRACPAELWRRRIWRDGEQEAQLSEFWYVAYHALFWLDLYLYGAEEGFAPPAPFALIEMERPYRLPDPPYTKEQVRAYLEHGRRTCRATVAALTDEKARRRCTFAWGEVTYLELLLYNMRHVQEHAAQLSLFLGLSGRAVPDYVTQASESISDSATRG